MASNNSESDLTKKRIRSDTSSSSSTSGLIEKEDETKNPKKKVIIETTIKKSGKDPKVSEKKTEQKGSEKKTEQDQMKSTLQEIQTQLIQINSTLANVLTKNDETLKSIVKEIVREMKEELFKAIEHRIDLLETKLFDKEEELSKQEVTIKKLQDQIKEQEEQNDNLKFEIRKHEDKSKEIFNNLEQYSRINNIRINGIPEADGTDVTNDSMIIEDENSITETKSDDREDKERNNNNDDTERKTNVPMPSYSEIAKAGKKQVIENAEETRDLVIKTLNTKLPGLNLTTDDIDTCHRLGRKAEGKNRQIIVRFQSRLVKEKIMRRKKELPKPLFISEDLTKQNHHILMCVRWKMPDEIDKCWSINGKICYKNKMGNIRQVNYNEFENWMGLPWPERDTQVGATKR